MKIQTVNIKNPSKDLLSFVREIKERKELIKKELIEKRDLYFSKQ